MWHRDSSMSGDYAPLDGLSLSELWQGESTYPRSGRPYRSPQRQRVLAECTILTLFIGKQVDRKRLYESNLFFAPHLDAHTSREAEVEIVEHTALEMEKLDEVAVNCLKNTLPGITKLRIVIGGKEDMTEQIIDRIIQLLEQWANKLETFGIWTDTTHMKFTRYGMFSTLLDPLFAVISEKLTSLKYLTMAIPEFFGKQDLDGLFNGRLKLFSTNMHIEDFPNAESTLLKLFSTSFYWVSRLVQSSLNPNGALQEKLTEARFFDWNTLTAKLTAKLPEMSDRWALKITALNLSYENEKHCKSFLAHFPALKWLQCAGLPVWETPHFLNSLSGLSRLKYLEMAFDSPKFDNVAYTDTTTQLDFQPLPSIETLSSILNGIQNHRFISFFEQFNCRFPSLKWFNVKWYCMETVPNPKETVTGCMLQFAQQQLKGSFQLTFLISLQSCYTYKEEFNFTEGRKFEDWQYKEENITNEIV